MILQAEDFGSKHLRATGKSHELWYVCSFCLQPLRSWFRLCFLVGLPFWTCFRICSLLHVPPTPTKPDSCAKSVQLLRRKAWQSMGCKKEDDIWKQVPKHKNPPPLCNSILATFLGRWVSQNVTRTQSKIGMVTSNDRDFWRVTLLFESPGDLLRVPTRWVLEVELYVPGSSRLLEDLVAIKVDSSPINDETRCGVWWSGGRVGGFCKVVVVVVKSKAVFRWWQLRHCLFSLRSLGKWSNLTHIFSIGLKPPSSFFERSQKCWHLTLRVMKHEI